jgi:serine/threonine protein kinase
MVSFLPHARPAGYADSGMTPRRGSEFAGGAPATGWTIGPYRLTSLIGRGGMAAVYAAVREGDAYEREVAIKIIQRGCDGEFTRARFLVERQILARLEHPNIASLLDAGISDNGMPYLVMERVHGEPITDFARRSELSVDQRLRLFLPVCAAVHYAHTHLVVHRDIKPANILVTVGGVPKLLDFGIAKLLQVDPEFRLTGSRILTPQYASPEQLLGAPDTTAFDVYSLGVLLYELLAGCHPFPQISPDTLDRRLAEEPGRPSDLAPERDSRRLRGDLDNIILKALRYDPARRYGSAEQLSSDIQRHLSGLPVRARPDTFLYRSTKYVARNRLPLATTVVILMTLGAGALVTALEADRAEHRFQQARKLANSLLFEFHDIIKPLPGSIEARQAVVQTALDYLSRLQKEASFDSSLQWDIAIAYEKVGDLQGYPYGDNLGQSAAALASYREALQIKTQVASLLPEESRWRSLSQTHMKISDLELAIGQTGAALSSIEAGLRLARKRVSPEADDHRLLGAGFARLGQIRAAGGDSTPALEAYRASNEHFAKLCTLEPSAENLVQLAGSFQRIGYALVWTGHLDDAMQAYRQAISISTDAVREDPSSNANLRSLVQHYNSLGDLLGSPFHVNLGDTDSAMHHYRIALEMATRMVARYPSDAQARISLNQSRMRHAWMLTSENPQRALDLSRQALATNDSLLANDNTNAEYRRDRGFILLGMGGILEALGRREEALAAYRQSLLVQDEVAARDPARTQFRQDMIPTRLFLGRLLASLGQTREASRHFRAALNLAEAQLQVSPNNLYSIRNLSDAYEAMAGMENPAMWRARNLDLWTAWETRNGTNAFTTHRRRRARQP